ncbi:MAG: hypothetical protein M0T79_01145 [Actinomycetota bacterium]|nr:hypothetical protein [Actinomycetota bacterium]
MQTWSNPKALYTSTNAGETWRKLAWHIPSNMFIGTLLCVSATSCVVVSGPELATTNDGARHWVSRPGFGITTTSCTTSGVCVGLQGWRSPNFPATGGRVETNLRR